MMNQTSDYLDKFRQNGRAISKIRQQAVDFAQTHFQQEQIESLVNQRILEAGGEPGFKKVPGYSWATCINVNDQIVHSPPRGYFNQGDVVTIDTGMYRHGTTSDCATTFVVGTPTKDQVHFLDVGYKTLLKAIAVAKPGNKVKDIAYTIQHHIEKAGFSVVRTLTGHAIGQTMHEEPIIPCYVSPDPALNQPLQVGMVLAIEVMYMMGDWPLIQAKDGWTLSTADGSLSAVFEDDIIITPSGPEKIT